MLPSCIDVYTCQLCHFLPQLANKAGPEACPFYWNSEHTNRLHKIQILAVFGKGFNEEETMPLASRHPEIYLVMVGLLKCSQI
jgi:hypothetical protein